jgi:isopenicillin-N epimerase
MTFAYTAPLSKDLFLLNPDIAFLNHGSFGATPRPVFEKYQWWQRELENQPVEFIGRRLKGLLREARASLADYIHTDADNIVYVQNATTGLNIVARSLPLKAGDEILTTDHEYGALDRTWHFVRKKTGVVYRHQTIPLPVTTTEDFIERLWAGVTTRTRVLFLSHITSPTALIFPLKELCHRAREAGIISVIDGAHALGQIPLDMADIGADFYSSNAHKWLCSPKGSAFLYARPEQQHLLEPLIVSWGYEARDPSGSQFIDEQEITGTRDSAAYLTVPTAIEFVKQHNWDKVRLQCHALAQYARQRLNELLGLPAISPDSTEWYMQMCLAQLPPCDLAQVKTRLYDEFGVEVPLVEWQGKQFIRVSIQAYNTQADVERLLNALPRVLDA